MIDTIYAANPAHLFNICLIADGLGTLISGILWYILPAWFLGLQTTRETDDIGIHMSSAFGAMVAASAVISISAFFSGSLDYKRDLFLMRVVGCTMISIAQLRAQFKAGSGWGKGHWLIGIGMNATWGLMDLVGLILILSIT